jgi:hypothetical protein
LAKHDHQHTGYERWIRGLTGLNDLNAGFLRLFCKERYVLSCHTAEERCEILLETGLAEIVQVERD